MGSLWLTTTMTATIFIQLMLSLHKMEQVRHRLCARQQLSVIRAKLAQHTLYKERHNSLS